MARPKSLAKMSFDALIDLRDSVTSAIGEQAESLRKQLASLTDGDSMGHGKRRGRPLGRKGSALKGRKARSSTATSRATNGRAGALNPAG
jgi:hypothetical protein